MMGDVNDVDMTNINLPITLRVRQYPESHKGPYIVNIRTKNEGRKKSLEVKKIQKYIFDKFKHVERVLVSEHKMRVVFSESAPKENIQLSSGEKLDTTNTAREEANKLPKCEFLNSDYRVYIPEKYVEIKGVISWSKNETLEDFCLRGEGKFNRSEMKEVRVLEAVRLMKKVDEASSRPSLENTGLVIVTFEGLVLPNKFHLDGLLANVREYRPKQMFCKQCLKYNHTEKMCNNKKVNPPENIKCVQCKSDDHESGSTKCPRRKILEKKTLHHDRQVRQKTYAELLHELDPHNIMPNESTQNLTQQNFPPIGGASRKRQAEQKRKEKELQAIYGNTSSPQRKKRPPAVAEDPPPGFVNPNLQKNEIAESCVDFIKTWIRKKNFPSFIVQIFENFAIPFIYDLIDQVTNSFTCNETPAWQTTTRS